MTKTELKENITKINKLLRSDSYEAGIELIKTLDDQEITKGTTRALISRVNKLLRSVNYQAGIELIKIIDTPEITKGTLKEALKHPDYYDAGLKSVKKIDVSQISESIIKLLLKQRDKNAIDTSIDLTCRLNRPEVFEALLEGCAISENGKLVRNKLFTGNPVAQPYLDYALLNFVVYAPNTANLDKSIALTNIKEINLTWCPYTRVPPREMYKLFEQRLEKVLINFPYLTSLDLNGCNYIIDLNNLTNLTNLTTLNLSSCGSLKNLDALANLTNLNALDLSNACALLYDDIDFGISLKNVDGLVNCTNLTRLILYGCKSLKNVNGLANLTNISSLNLGYCDKVNPKPSKEVMTIREEVAAYQEEIKKSMK
jgi:Leucine-rich repeat (LRR) protein